MVFPAGLGGEHRAVEGESGGRVVQRDEDVIRRAYLDLVLDSVELVAGIAPSRAFAPQAPSLAVSDARPSTAVALDEVYPTEIVDDRGVIMVFVPGGAFTVAGDSTMRLE